MISLTANKKSGYLKEVLTEALELKYFITGQSLTQKIRKRNCENERVKKELKFIKEILVPYIESERERLDLPHQEGFATPGSVSHI